MPLAGGRTVRVPTDHETIQDALDASRPGDVVLVDPGVYPEALRMSTEGVELHGVDRNTVVLSGDGRLDDGIAVTADDVAITSLTVRGYRRDGIRIGATADDPLEGYRVAGVTLDRNGGDGISIGAASGGRIEQVLAWGHPGAGIALRSCFPCRLNITKSASDHNGTGILVSNAGGDTSIGETTIAASRRGIVLATETAPTAPQRDVDLADNRLEGGDLTTTPGAASPWPEGVGILIAGGRANQIDRNRITGFAAAGLEISDVAGTLAEANEVRTNIVSGNGVDLVFSGEGTPLGNCFRHNTFDSSSPPDIQSTQSCFPESTGGRGARATTRLPRPASPAAVPAPRPSRRSRTDPRRHTRSGAWVSTIRRPTPPSAVCGSRHNLSPGAVIDGGSVARWPTDPHRPRAATINGSARSSIALTEWGRSTEGRSRSAHPRRPQWADIGDATVWGRRRSHFISSSPGSGGLRWKPCTASHPSVAQVVERVLVLDPLGHDLHAEVVAELDDRAHDHRVVAVLGQARDEGAVDLELGDRHPLELVERREAHAEVVDREGDAEGVEILEHRDRPGRVGHDRALGDLELEHAVLEPGPVDVACDAIDEVVVVEAGAPTG